MGTWHGDEEESSKKHYCGTTHCRAGWVVALAGEKGKALEEKLGSTSEAAALIYLKSDKQNLLSDVPDFYTDNAEALADMRSLARREANALKRKAA